MLIKKTKRNKQKQSKQSTNGPGSKTRKKYNSGGLGRKRCRLSFDPVKSLDRRCMRGCTLRVFDLDIHPSIWTSWVQFEAKLLSFETLNRNLRM